MSRHRREQTHDQAQAETVSIWETLISEYRGVKQKFTERLANIQKELDKWEEKKQTLVRQYSEADERIEQYQDKIAEAARMRREQRHAVKTGKRRTESKLGKAQRLAKELASLTAELRREGIDLE